MSLTTMVAALAATGVVAVVLYLIWVRFSEEDRPPIRVKNGSAVFALGPTITNSQWSKKAHGGGRRAYHAETGNGRKVRRFKIDAQVDEGGQPKVLCTMIGTAIQLDFDAGGTTVTGHVSIQKRDARIELPDGGGISTDDTVHGTLVLNNATKTLKPLLARVGAQTCNFPVGNDPEFVIYQIH